MDGAQEEARIDTSLLIPGRGEGIRSASLIYSPGAGAGGRGKILWVGEQDHIPHRYASVPVREHVPVLMPGLWDCHVHFFGRADPNIENLAVLPLALAGVRCARDIAATLNAGYTSVREVGGNGAELSKAINEGWVPGPTIYSSVAPISQTAGHGDLHTFPIELLQERNRNGFPLWICDGMDECTKAVRTQIRRGAKLIKVHATGGIMSRIDSPLAPQFSPRELKAIVEEANKADLLVAAHCHGKAGIMNALEAGVKTIEHGSYLDEEAIGLMKEKDAMLVATRAVFAVGLTHPQNMAPESYKKLVEVADAHKKAYAAAVKAGVKCALGTDLGISSKASEFNHGMNGLELGYAVDAGMTPLQALEAATANGPLTLGLKAPLSGQLAGGYDADFIALSRDPLRDISVLADPQNVTHVWKAGKLCKAPGRPISFF